MQCHSHVSSWYCAKSVPFALLSQHQFLARGSKTAARTFPGSLSHDLLVRSHFNGQPGISSTLVRAMSLSNSLKEFI